MSFYLLYLISDIISQISRGSRPVKHSVFQLFNSHIKNSQALTEHEHVDCWSQLWDWTRSGHNTRFMLLTELQPSAELPGLSPGQLLSSLSVSTAGLAGVF